MGNHRKRRVSVGTIAVLSVTLLVLAGTGVVWARLSSGKPVDLSGLHPESLDLRIVTGSPETVRGFAMADSATPAPAMLKPSVPEESETENRSFTLTAAGTVILNGEVRQNSYYSDTKQYDYYDTMMLLKKEVQSDLNIVFPENLFSEEGKINDLTAPGAGAAMLNATGFNIAACGFSKAFEKAEDGIASTRRMLEEHGIQTLGIYTRDETDRALIRNVNGIKTALLQYTDSIPAATRKKMAKNGQDHLVPAADPATIAADITDARKLGCEAVIVLMNWGKTGKAPDKNMRILAQQITDAGADLIIGSGSRIVSGAEMLTAGETGRQVLCVWSLGTALSGDRSGIKRIAGMLLQATVEAVNGEISIRDLRYIPLYTWKYRQDSRYYYRCLAADRPIPDGMDSEQQKMMKKAAETVRNAMKDSPLEERAGE